MYIISVFSSPPSLRSLSANLANHNSTNHVIFIKVRHDHGIELHDKCTHVWKNLYECLRKNVISTLKINIFLKFNVLRNTGCLLVPLNFEFEIKKYFKKRYDAFCKTSIQIFFEDHHFFKLKNQRNRNSLALSLVVEFLKKNSKEIWRFFWDSDNFVTLSIC